MSFLTDPVPIWLLFLVVVVLEIRNYSTNRQFETMMTEAYKFKEYTNSYLGNLNSRLTEIETAQTRHVTEIDA